ncbi:hypothetical protein CONLIGDRAFT_699438 [Coniochaeta ligniaria NRRL 30616]|uniref:DUF7730 domain-containing protein n=1 Tax=Coniochaeta ligniaria NRRL 30616 TaxID=1408157 RepID=A0A1J7JRL1_9PEZI|nr:hypothetical protein CONLIGDRAFT_699438 [Coniochaeta ligniaria NRRL 30616]
MEHPQRNHSSLIHSQEAPAHHPSQDNEYSQPTSPFFGRLPPEIRHQIYDAILHSAGRTQHIYKSDTGPGAAVTHTRCRIDPDDEDLREQRYFETFDEDAVVGLSNEDLIYDQKLWRGRQYTDWCNHWQCEETLDTEQFSAFLGPLLVCKRMRDEFLPVVYSSLTFSFINTPALSRFLATTSSRYLALIRSVHLIWCAPPETRTLDNSPEDDDDDDDTADPATTFQAWKSLWSHLSSACPRVSHVRVWIYGRFARFPMPAGEYFEVLDDFADNSPGVGQEPRRVMDRFTVQTVWTREFDGFAADGQEVHEDDGEVVPDWLRGRRFEVERTAAVEYEPEVWMVMWARPSLAGDTGGRGMGARREGRGWGVRAVVVRGEDGREGVFRG